MRLLAFIGLGNMGLSMAINLVKAGYIVKGFDISKTQLNKFESIGGIVVKEAKNAVKDADIVISMLPTSEDVYNLYCKKYKLLEYIDKQTLVIDCSTIDVTTTKKIAKTAKLKEIEFIDAPVSGGTEGAKNGTLTFMVGGNNQQLKKANTFLRIMGSEIFIAGPVGSGQIAKQCNNMLLAILMIGTSEALALGITNGLDAHILSEIMLNSSGKNWVLEAYNPVPGILREAPASHNYKNGFATSLILKDLSLAIKNSIKNNSKIPMGRLAYDIFAKTNETKLNLDFSSIFEIFYKNKI